MYSPRSGTHRQQAARAAQSSLSVTRDFAQGFRLFGHLNLTLAAYFQEDTAAEDNLQALWNPHDRNLQLFRFETEHLLT